MTEFDKKVLGILQLAIQHKVSDVHLAAGSIPAFRTHDGISPLNLPAFTHEEMLAACQLFVAKPEVKAKLGEITDYDGSFEYPGLGRFRFNIFRHKNQLGAVLRVIASKVPSIADLGLPPVLKKIAEASRGLVLVTGATGSGKSSTLAAMIDHINATQACHILTIEDPIEYVHTPKKSRITQREVGRDTADFASALRSALRQDPDVILVGEMRDIETLDIALKAAETGHLVFSTVHTTDAIKTIGRLISMYPAEEQHAVRLRLSDNIHATVSQRLVNSVEPNKKVVAQEIMISNLAIRDCIASDKKTGEMNTFIEKGHEVIGSQTFDQHLSFLVQRGQVSVEVALEAATNPADFQRNLAFGEHGHALEGNNAENIQMEPVAPTAEDAKYAIANAASKPEEKTSPTATKTTVGSATATATTLPGGPPKIPKPPKAA